MVGVTDAHELLAQVANDRAVTGDAIQRLCRRRQVLRDVATKLRIGAHPAIVETERAVKLTDTRSSSARR